MADITMLILADHEWFRDLVISKIMVSTLEKLKMQYPKITQDLKAIRKLLS